MAALHRQDDKWRPLSFIFTFLIGGHLRSNSVETNCYIGRVSITTIGSSNYWENRFYLESKHFPFLRRSCGSLLSLGPNHRKAYKRHILQKEPGFVGMMYSLFLLGCLGVPFLVQGGFIDMDTPLDKRTTRSFVDGTVYHLVSWRFAVSIYLYAWSTFR